MTSLAFFIERIAFGLYILSAGGILWMAYRLYAARRELSASQFKLEREHALVRQASAITLGGLLIEFAVAVWAIANLVAPTLRDLQTTSNPSQTTSLERFVTSTPAPNAGISLDTSGQVDEGPAIFATPENTPTPVGTILPEAPDIVGCARDAAWLLVPGNGQRLFEATEVWGTATTADFAFYRFEIRPAEAGANWAPIGGDYTEPVVDGPLGSLLPWQFANGTYRFRLAVFDNTNIQRSVCEVTVTITDPPATPTPSAQPPE